MWPTRFKNVATNVHNQRMDAVMVSTLLLCMTIDCLQTFSMHESRQKTIYNIHPQ